MPHTSCLIPHASYLMPHASCLIPHASYLGASVPRASSLEHKRHRPIVLQRDDHHFSKTAGANDDAGRSKLAHEELEHRSRALRLLRVVEARAASFRDRSCERELRHGENRAAGLCDVEIHFSRVVAEDSQLANLPRRLAHFVFGVAFFHRGEYEQSALDL